MVPPPTHHRSTAFSTALIRFSTGITLLLLCERPNHHPIPPRLVAAALLHLIITIGIHSALAWLIDSHSLSLCSRSRQTDRQTELVFFVLVSSAFLAVRLDLVDCGRKEGAELSFVLYIDAFAVDDTSQLATLRSHCIVHRTHSRRLCRASSLSCHFGC